MLGHAVDPELAALDLHLQVTDQVCPSQRLGFLACQQQDQLLFEGLPVMFGTGGFKLARQTQLFRRGAGQGAGDLAQMPVGKGLIRRNAGYLVIELAEVLGRRLDAAGSQPAKDFAGNF